MSHIGQMHHMRILAGVHLRPFALCAAFACVLVLSAFVGNTVRAQAQAADGAIAFVRVVGDERVVHILEPDGSLRTVHWPDAEAHEDNSHPAWSPDGTRLAFLGFAGARARSLVVVDADGSNAREVVAAHMCASGPSWSPDGTRLAGSICDAETVTPELFTVPADGSEEPTVVPNSEGFVEPDWSPDGESLAFLGAQNPDNEKPDRPVARMSLDGTGYTELVESGEWADPEWRPDGTEVAYWFVAVSSTCQAHVRVVSSDGSGAVEEVPAPEPNNSCGYGEPSWSADGARLVFGACTRDERGCGLYTARRDGSDAQRHVNADSDGSLAGFGQPSWYGSAVPTGASQPTEPPSESTEPPADSRSSGSASATVLRPGQQLTASGDGFAPESDLEIEFHSDPVRLGTTRSDADGRYSATISIPSDATAGPHRIVVRGPGADGGTHESVTEVRVLASVATLPATGSPWPVVGVLGVGFLLLGLMLAAWARRLGTTTER